MKQDIEKNQDFTLDPTWKRKALLSGTLIGASVGLIGAYMLIQHTEKVGNQPNLSVKEGVKLGALVFGLLRQVALLGN